METFNFYFQLGFEHVLDTNGLDHFYYLIVLTIPFLFLHWKRVVGLVSIFTLGHTLSLALAFNKWITLGANWVEFFIPVTIVITCIPTLFERKKSSASKSSPLFMSTITFAFGLIHGLGFARYFSQIVLQEDAYSALFSFAFGVEGAQLIIVLTVLIANFIVVNIFRYSQQKWGLIIAAMIAGLAGQMAIENWPF